MSKISRPNNGAIYFIIALLAIPLLAGAFYLGVDKGRFDRAPYNHTQHYSEYTDAEIGNICGASTTKEKAIECAIKNKTKHRDAKRDEFDLAAQQEMAHWAEYLLYVSGIGVILSLIGLCVLAYTLLQTGQAVNAANKTNELIRGEQRSWIKLHLPKLLYKTGNNVDHTLSDVCYKIENVGVLTAVDVSVRVKVFTSSRCQASKASSYFREKIDEVGNLYEIDALFRNDPIKLKFGIGNPDHFGDDPDEGTYFIIIVGYKTDGDQTSRSSSRVYGINDKGQLENDEIRSVKSTGKFT